MGKSVQHYELASAEEDRVSALCTACTTLTLFHSSVAFR